MKKLLLLISILVPANILLAQEHSKELQITDDVINQLSTGQNTAVYNLFDDNMKAAMTLEKLGEIWPALISQCGKFNGSGESIVMESQGYVVVNQLIDFESTDLDIRIAFNNQKQISGLFFVPPVKKKRVTEPGLVSTASFTETAFILKSGRFSLPGTLTLPKGENNFPIVIFVHGSGPNDRDETIGPNKPFRNIAHGLADKGIASLRYDKRTFVYGIQAFSHPDSMNLASEVLDDVKDAVDTLRQINGVSEVFILGHSLGGMLAPEIAKENPELNGIIMLAANARPFAELIVTQTEYLLGADGMQVSDERAMLELREQMEILDKFDSGIDIGDQSLPLKLPKAYWRSILDYDQLAEIKSVKIPVLILQGERDYQVTMEDFELWKRATIDMQNVTFQSFPKLNNLFLEGEGPSYPSEYGIESDVPTYVTETIVNWINGIN